MAQTDGNPPVRRTRGRRAIRLETSDPALRAIVPTRAKRLLRTPMPHDRESLLPYALRLSEANGYLTPGYFLTAPTATQFSVSRHMAAPLVRESAGLDEGQMARLIYASAEDDAASGRLLGKRVGLYDLQLRTPRICPACVDENGYIEALWDLAWVRACPVHARKLLDTCPMCSTRFTWSRPGIAKCPKGHDVSKVVCEEATREEVGVARFLARKLYGEMGVDCLEHIGDSYLSAISLHESCHLAARLTNRLSMCTSARKRTVRGRGNLIGLTGSVTSLHALLCGSSHDRQALFKILSVDPATGAQHRSFHAAFNWLLTLFPKERAVEILAPLLKELFAFAAEHWPQSRLGRTAVLFRPFVLPSKWMSVVASARRIGITSYRVTEGIARGDVPHKKVSEKTNHNFLLPVVWVEQQAAVLGCSMHSTRLRKLFSLNVRVVDLLRAKRVFIPSIKASPGQILEHDMGLLAERLFRLSPGEVDSASEGEVTFHHLMRGRESHVSKATIAMAILEGSLKPTGNVAGQMLPGMLVDKAAVQHFLASRIALCSEKMQLGDVARLLDCRNVKALLEAGHLEMFSLHGSRTYVTTDSVKRFSDSYMSARLVIRETGIAIPKLLKVARFADIRLLSVPDTHRVGGIWFIPRAEREALLSAVPRFRDAELPRSSYPSEKRRVALVRENIKRRRMAAEASHAHGN
jgi:hypothetical protein